MFNGVLFSLIKDFQTQTNSMWNCLRCGIKWEFSLKSLKHSQTHQYENNEQKKKQHRVPDICFCTTINIFASLRTFHSQFPQYISFYTHIYVLFIRCRSSFISVPIHWTIKFLNFNQKMMFLLRYWVFVSFPFLFKGI